ncbi:MAG: chromate transporter [Rikenellaceae bacterium]
MIYLQLFISYIKIGFFGFGGGYAMLSLIHNEVVVQRTWVSNAELSDIIAISQMTPGPIAINSATYIGYTVAGIWGSIIATIASCLPALTLMIVVTRFFFLLRDNHIVKRVMSTMHPVVIGMICAAAITLIFPEDKSGANFIDAWSWILFGAALILGYRKFNLMWLIVLSALAGIAIYYLPDLFSAISNSQAK